MCIRDRFSDIDSYNDQCQSNISQCHNGNNNAAYFSNALYTTEDNKQCGYGNNPSYDGVVETECMFKSCTQRIALYGVEGCLLYTSGHSHQIERHALANGGQV